MVPWLIDKDLSKRPKSVWSFWSNKPIPWLLFITIPIPKAVTAPVNSHIPFQKAALFPHFSYISFMESLHCLINRNSLQSFLFALHKKMSTLSSPIRNKGPWKMLYSSTKLRRGCRHFPICISYTASNCFVTLKGWIFLATF